MKKFKAVNGYETVLAAECSVSGCKVILDAETPAAVKKYAVRYMDRGKSLLLLALIMGLLLKIFYSVEISSFAQTGSGAKGYDAVPEVRDTEDSIPDYREYTAAFEAVYPKQEIRIGAEDCVRYEENGQTAEPVRYQEYEGMEGSSIYTGADSTVEFAVDVAEEGFYALSVNYYPMEGSGSSIVRRILIDGAVPYREFEQVAYDRVWKPDTAEEPESCSELVSSVRRQAKQERKPEKLLHMTEKATWITASSRDGSGRIAEPLCVYLTKGEHTISFLSVREPMLIHQIVLGCAKPAQEYRQVKGFWDAVGIRAADGQTVCIEAEQMSGASVREIGMTKKRFLHAAFPMSISAKGVSDGIGGSTRDQSSIFWEQAGQWVEWEFDVEKAGYYHISLHACQNYRKEADVYRKILIDGTAPFQEMERYGFAYGWGWKEKMLSEDTGAPYVFYLKEGHHTLRMEAVSGSEEPEDAETDQPLSIDRIRIVPVEG